MNGNEILGKSYSELIDTGEIVTTSIFADKLPLYQQAAKVTGYRIATIAQPGEKYLGRSTSDMGGGYLLAEYEVLEGMLGISIESPSPAVDHSAFWNEFSRLQEAHAQPERPLDATS